MFLLLIMVVSSSLIMGKQYLIATNDNGDYGEGMTKQGSITRRIISSDKAPDAIGPYNQAIQVDNHLYVAGNVGFIPETMEIIEGGVVAETTQALTNMKHILEAAGCSFDNVVKTTVMLADINEFGAMNDVYKKFFLSNYPARAAYQVAALPRGARVEIEAIAVVGDITTH